MLFNAGQLVVTTLENTFTFGDFGASGYVRVRFWYVMVLYGSGLTTLFGSGSIRVSVLHIRRTIGRGPGTTPNKKAPLKINFIGCVHMPSEYLRVRSVHVPPPARSALTQAQPRCSTFSLCSYNNNSVYNFTIIKEVTLWLL